MLYRPDGRLAAGSTTETAADIAEDFNLGSCGHRASPEEAVVDPRAGKVLNRMDYALMAEFVRGDRKCNQAAVPSSSWA